MIFGSLLGDTLTTSAGGDIIFSYTGDDDISSTHLNTNLFAGEGDDILDSSGLFVFAGGTGDLQHSFGQFGGEGDDDHFVDVKVDTVEGNTVNGIFYGDGGDDTMDITIAGTATGGAPATVAVQAVVDGGNGDDNMTISAGSGATSTGTIDVAVTGGRGSDTIYATASDSDYTGDSTNVLVIDGGAGNDQMTGAVGLLAGNSAAASDVSGVVQMFGGFGLDTLTTSINSNTPFGANADVTGSVFADGGGANDQLTNNMTASGTAGSISYDANLNGGLGLDTINSNVSANAIGDANGSTFIDGGGGADDIDSILSVLGSTGTATAFQEIQGGIGADDIYGLVQITNTGAGNTGTNSIDGGNGHDVIVGEILGQGENHLYGGIGNDSITSISGAAFDGSEIHELHGGNGNDTLTGGDGIDDLFGDSGNDTLIASQSLLGIGHTNAVMYGGTGADTFVFDLSVNQSVSDIGDWSDTQDILQFVGLADGGAPGLVDDIDALATFADNGSDVTVTFASGTLIKFVGMGTGSINSIGDLVTDPFAQLIA
ncbi:beta strand repeat-containing protein [Octadecabacter sp. R77987]|uniref:beta strand repeat-containing protein n=1 Tax=Octadecabacter sp. R77987 TaxID=3093874 RepID=UPI00366A7921